MRGLLAAGPKNSPAEAGEASEIVSLLRCCCSAVVGVVVGIVPVVIISPKPSREIVVAILFGTTATLSGNSPLARYLLVDDPPRRDLCSRIKLQTWCGSRKFFHNKKS